ncbi:o-succinylbenzoate synthase [Pseudoclavibacter soli]|uniref:o-succinylbenzoate synthase n=1 Tax=Pseudoclavibacter soli TaxID=452623 RepID=UPI00041A5E7B|nr:o-succinylbenzoate synthase [Pseudoclavibacter soli]
MTITRVQLHEVRLPLVHSFQTSSHRKSSLDHILVELTDDDGRSGWGEIASPADPYYCAETTDTAWLIAQRYLVPRVLEAHWSTPAELESTWGKIRGHEFTKAGFAGAAWDLFSQREGMPLAATLGGSRHEVRAGVSLGIEPTVDELLAQVAKQLSAGYHRIKLKIAPGWDLEPVRAVRSAYPEIDLHVDANGAYSSDEDTVAYLRQLDEARLTMIEQPFTPRDFTGHARLQQRLDTPVCLDESVVSLDDLETMIALDAGRILNIKVSRMGGLTTAKAAHDLATAHDIPVWCGGMHEFGVGRAANVAISSLPGFTLPSDVSGSDKYYARDVIVPPVTAHAGTVTVPDAPGIGHEVDREWVAQNRLRHLDTAQHD